MDAEAELAAGIVTADAFGPDRAAWIDAAKDALAAAFTPSSVWRAGVPSPESDGRTAYGEELPLWRAVAAPTADEQAALTQAWRTAFPPTAGRRGDGEFFRVRVETPEDARRLRGIGTVGALRIVPSLESRGGRRPFEWRWPLRIGVVGPSASTSLVDVRGAGHHGVVYDAELWSPDVAYDLAIIDAVDLTSLPVEEQRRLGEVASVIVIGDAAAEELLAQLEETIGPAVAIAFTRPPYEWWPGLFEELSHDVPLDAALESVVSSGRVDGLIAAPRIGLDVTASAHWFVAVAPDSPTLGLHLDDAESWRWDSEGQGASIVSQLVRSARGAGEDPAAVVRGAAMAEPAPDLGADADEEGAGGSPDKSSGVTRGLPGLGAEPPESTRRLIARVLDGDSAVETVLPPQKDLVFAVRIAIPEQGDIAADEGAPALPAGPGPVAELEIVVRGDVWPTQPASQRISISRVKQAQPSSWASFPFTTPAAGDLVSIEIVVLYQGKPLQALSYVSPVRAQGLPGEKPTLTTYALTGPDEPTDDLRPVEASLDGRTSDLRHVSGSDATVSIGDAQAKLDAIEDRVSRVLGVEGAPDTFDHPKALELLISLARLGSELKRQLEPLGLDDAKSINVSVNAETPVFPFELVYSAPPPQAKTATLCPHVASPPPVGEACTQASADIVCPYAFWGLHRTISRTVYSPVPANAVSRRPATPASPFSVLYAATDIADDGAAAPLPSTLVLKAAELNFAPVAQVKTWDTWRKRVETEKPSLLVVLGHTMREGGETRLYIGKDSSISRVDISDDLVRAGDGPPPLVLLIACATSSLGDPFGTLPGALSAHGAGAVVGTLSKIVGPQGAEATVHLLDSLHGGGGRSVGDAVADARRALVARRRPLGLLLVSHGELDTTVRV